MKILKHEILKNDSQWKGKIFLSHKVVIRFEMDKNSGWKQWGASIDYLKYTAPLIENYWRDFIKPYSTGIH